MCFGVPKSIYFTDEAYQQITEAARLCGFRVSRGRGSQIALFVVAAANTACSGRVVVYAPKSSLLNQTWLRYMAFFSPHAGNANR